MNKQIRQLAKEAKQYAIEQKEHKGIDGLFMHDVFVQEFAELIIGECCQHLTNIGYDSSREALEKYFGLK